jgi:hypothetical protein
MAGAAPILPDNKDAVKSADDAVILLYKNPTDENKKWFDGVFGDGASQMVFDAMGSEDEDEFYDSSLKVFHKFGWGAFDAVRHLYYGDKKPGFNAPRDPEDEKELKGSFYSDPNVKPPAVPGFNVGNRKLIPGFNKKREGKPVGVYEDGKTRKSIPGFNAPKD